MKWYKNLSDTWKFVIKLSITLIVIGLLILGGYFLFDYLGWLDLSREEIEEFISSFGIWGPIIFIFISFLQVTFIPIPSTVTILAGSYLFGFWQSFLYSYIGILLGSIFAYVLGKWIGRPFVNWLAGGQDKVDKLMAKMKGKERVVIFFMFLFPFFPDDLICALCGIIPSINWPFFLITQFLTRATSILGNLVFLSGRIIPYDQPWGIALIVIFCVIGLALFILSFIYSDKINKLFDKFTTWIQVKVFKKEKFKVFEDSVGVQETTANINNKQANFEEITKFCNDLDKKDEEKVKSLDSSNNNNNLNN